MTNGYAIDDLLTAVRELGPVLQPVRVAGVLRGVRVDERTLAPYLTWSAGRYTRNLIARDERFELIAICWDRDARSPIHDHADSDCAFVLHAGSVTCEAFRVSRADDDAAPHDVRLLGERTLRAGELDMTSGHLSVHRVGARDGRAITLHVYTKPIDRCLHYGEDGSFREAISRYDTVPVLAG